MGVKNNLLESASGMTKIDCTSRKVEIIDFCLQNTSSDKSFIRGRVDSLSKDKVLCEYADSVILKMSCDDKTVDCNNEKKSCKKLQSVFAFSLDNHHAGSKGKILTCIYSSDKELKL